MLSELDRDALMAGVTAYARVVAYAVRVFGKLATLGNPSPRQPWAPRRRHRKVCRR